MAVSLTGQRFLDSTRIKRIVTKLAAELEKNRPLVYLNRTPIVNAFEDEIFGRFTGSIIAADIIADDQGAVVQEAGKVEFTSNQVPNLKIGQRMGQNMLNRMHRMEAGLGTAEEEDAMFDWEQMIAENLLLGVRQRMNALCVAMALDTYSYDRLGIKLSGASWGMPAALKVTPTQAWSTDGTTANASATPISDIMAMDNIASDAYGTSFDRITMSSKTLGFFTGTTEFANKASIPLQAGYLLAASSLSLNDREAMKTIAGKILNKDIEIDDGTFNERTNAGTKTTSRYLPHNKVLLSRKQDDNDGNVMDFANGVVTESIVGSLIDNGPGGLTSPAYGPMAYYTADPLFNPPGVIAWAVARGFPRKHIPEATAVLTVGTYTT